MDKSLILLDPEDEHLRRWGWNHSKQSKYLRARLGSAPPVALHRLITGAKAGEFVDHINGDPWDNRRCNLRICSTRGDNNRNRRARHDSKAPYKGITKSRSGRWLAQIQAHNQYHRIGLFDTPEEAAAAYDIAARQLHGEFARVNGLARGDSPVRGGG